MTITTLRYKMWKGKFEMLRVEGRGVSVFKDIPNLLRKLRSPLYLRSGILHELLCLYFPQPVSAGTGCCFRAYHYVVRV